MIAILIVISNPPHFVIKLRVPVKLRGRPCWNIYVVTIFHFVVKSWSWWLLSNYYLVFPLSVAVFIQKLIFLI